MITMEEKVIGGVSISKWKEAFRKLCEIVIDKDYFSDILYFDLYPNIDEELAAIDEDAQCDIYNAKMNYAYEALKEIFRDFELYFVALFIIR